LTEPHLYTFELPRVANAGSNLSLQAKGSAGGSLIESTVKNITITERNKANITGTVQFDNNGVNEPVAGAVVTIDNQSYSVETDVNGVFTLSSVFIDEAFDISISHVLRGEKVIWEQTTVPTVISGVIDIGDIVFHDDDIATIYDESTGNELSFNTTQNEYKYYPSSPMRFRGYQVDYISIRKDKGYISLYDMNGNKIQFIQVLPLSYGLRYQKMAGIRVSESTGYIAITYDSTYVSGIEDSGMTVQIQFRTDGSVKLLYGSSLIDLGTLSGYVEFAFSGNSSGDYVSADLDYSSFTLADKYLSKPYNRLKTSEYFYPSSPFDLMGNVLHFDYDLTNGYRIWTEPLDSIPVPLQYPQAGSELFPPPVDSVPNPPPASGWF
jgi:hypothetical protein